MIRGERNSLNTIFNRFLCNANIASLILKLDFPLTCSTFIASKSPQLRPDEIPSLNRVKGRIVKKDGEINYIGNTYF